MTNTNKTEMSLTQALSELKTLDRRISKSINCSTFAVALVGGKTKDRTPVEEAIKRIKSDLQSVEALMKRRTAIKSALTLANATTDVTIGGVTMKIAEAIDLKSSISHKKDLIDSLERNLSQAREIARSQNSGVQQEISKMTNGTDNKNGKDSDFLESYKKQFEGSVLDPIKAEEKIAQLKKEVDDFETEVDYKLSTVNALTVITF
jgi:chromosome segregation ATPase